jgi:hypothetical protein
MRAKAAGLRHQHTAKRTPEVVRLYLNDVDRVTGEEGKLYTLSYEQYRGYTIYSLPTGRCCIHGVQGCLRLHGQFVSFPNEDEAMNLIRHFRALGWRAADPVDRELPSWMYTCVQPPRRRLVGGPSMSR